MEIVNCPDEEKKVKQFNTYIRQEENLKKFQRIFPIIATTSISAHKIGEPGTYFDMVIMDEASQGNIAMSLVPIIRGRSLMLVGDPQQLSPVILLNPIDNEKLKRIYGVTDEYDYIKNSIYKTYLACDAVSEEILLSHHYRCNKKIISFNNKKYYNNKLIINSPDKEANPLIFKNIPANTTNYKNTAPQEVEEIISFIKEHPDKSIGIITPFTNQKELINKALKDNGMENIPCGTVHAFQGDEKDVVLFSLAITQQTYQGTYDWLKNNKELINVATSRAKDQLVILSDIKELKRLHSAGDDDIYELVDYVQTNGEAQVTARETSSRALGIKPYSTQTEAAFLTTLNHALDNVLNTNNRCVVQREVSIAHVFQENESYDDLFYTGRFDFVASLVARFFDTTEGRILIGNKDVKEISSRQLMDMVSFVFQDSKLLKTSILENVRMGKKEATREEVMQALKEAQCEDIIAKLPDGIDTVIGSSGTYVSGGEAQRFSIARAMLKNAPILILDEATAFADPDNEAKVQEAFSRLSKGKTVIMIAHRLSSIVDADRICVLKDGSIAEEGTHETLLQKNGVYAHMWEEYNKSVQWKVGA